MLPPLISTYLKWTERQVGTVSGVNMLRCRASARDQSPCLHCPASNGFAPGRNSDSTVSAQHLVLWPEMDWTRWWVQSQTSGRQQRRGLRGSPCETKQSTSCSVRLGRSFWPQLCLDRPQQSLDTERAARGNQTHARMLTRTIIACPWWQWYWEPMKEHLDTLAKGNYAWKCPTITNWGKYPSYPWLIPSI